MDPFTAPVRSGLEQFETRLDAALRADVQLVHEVARYMAHLRGKRFRPVLALLGAKALGLEDGRIVDAAVAVELIHAATMMHDDVVDSASMRRGRASVSSAWSGQVAVLMGDFLLSRALGTLVSLGNMQALAVVARATERLSVGEIFEIQISGQRDTSADSYFRMVGDKTASLISAACQLGPLLVEAPRPVVSALGQYGEMLGRAFQIADDVLDFTGDAATLGKPVGLDLREGKITLPLIHALETASPAARERVEGLLGRASECETEWRQVVDFVMEQGGVEKARQTARTIAGNARGHLMILPPSPARDALEAAVDMVVERKS